MRRFFHRTEQAKARFVVRKPVAAQRDSAFLSLHQLFQHAVFRCSKAVEIVDKNGFVRQKRRVQPERGGGNTVRRVHGGAGDQRLIGGENQSQLVQLAAVLARGAGHVQQRLGACARRFQLFDGVRAHAAKARAAPVTAVGLQLVAQRIHSTAHCNGPGRVRQRFHRCAAKGLEHQLSKAGKAVYLRTGAERIAQRAVHHRLGRGRKLFRHQQDAAPPRGGAHLHLGQHTACFARA